MSEDLESELPEPEVSESEVPELEVSEVYLADEAPELSQETRRELVSIGQRKMILF